MLHGNGNTARVRQDGAGASEHVYILGAGRSGTTLLSVLLGANAGLRARGELLHLPIYWKENRRCSCGLAVKECPVWREAGRALAGNGSEAEVDAAIRDFARAERHSNVLHYLLAPRHVSRSYIEHHEAIFDAIAAGGDFVDASKYVARALAFTQLEKHSFRYVYIVRDCRGAIHSMTKKDVQRTRSLLSSVGYYLSVNIAAQIAVWTRLRGRAIKLRYEDLVADPQRELTRLGAFLGLDMGEVIRRISGAEPIEIGHIVSGNRLRAQGAIRLSNDDAWRRNFGPLKRYGLYLLCLPVQLLNRYSP